MQPPTGGQMLPGSQPMGYPAQQGLARPMYQPQPNLTMQQQQYVQSHMQHHMQHGVGAMAAAHHMQAAGGGAAMAQHHVATQQHLLAVQQQQQQQHLLQQQQAATSAAMAISQPMSSSILDILKPDPPMPSPSQAVAQPNAAPQLGGGAAAAAGAGGSAPAQLKPKPKTQKRRKGEADIMSLSYAEHKEQQEKKRRLEMEGGGKGGEDGADAAVEEATALRLTGGRRARARGPARDANELLPQAELERLMTELGIGMDFRLHPEVLPLLGTHVDSLLNATLDFGAGLARRRKGMAAMLRPQDLAAYMSRTYGLTVPGLHSQVVPYRRPAASELHKARAAALRQAEVPKVGRGGAGRAGAAAAAEGRGRAALQGFAADADADADHG